MRGWISHWIIEAAASRADDPSPIGVTAMTEETLFTTSLEKATKAERAAFLNMACAGDAALRRRVEALLESHEHAGFLSMPAVERAEEVFGGVGNPGSTRSGANGHDLPDSVEDTVGGSRTIARARDEPLGIRIGCYKMLQQIGEGGMGAVFVAEQTHPVRRQVALKLIKAGMDTRQVIARFEAERQALALMDHPNIARVLDAGATNSGRPYFVMELVKGVPITRYCDELRLTTRQRLELFIPVCQAVQHAHQKGIIHRDLKPSNVLIALYDGEPVPKVIDFGVAKAAGQSLTDKTLATGLGNIVGTLEYMSPEQAELNQLDVDTRSDIYSLGVLLYELLTGSTPLGHKQLRETAFLEVLRLIREDEPPRPSYRLSTTEELTRIAACRNIEPRKLSGLLRGDLDWIVMKALEKSRDRRYQTASGLAMDLLRHLRDEPVLACPPSGWYSLRKLAWRYKGTFAAASGVALTLLLTVITLAISNSYIRREQERTRQEKVRAEEAQELADSRANEIRQGLSRLKAANALLDRGRWYASERRWDDAHEAFSQAITLHPEHVSVWAERGDLYTRLGLWDLAAADYAGEMELHQPEITLRWYQHALLRRAVGDEEGCRRAGRAMRERFAGTLEGRFLEETLRASLLVPDPAANLSELIELAREAATSRNGSMPYVLGIACLRAGGYDEVVRLLQQWAAEPHWAIRFLSYPVLAMAHHHLGHETEARQALAEAAHILDRWTQERFVGQGGNWEIHPRGDVVWPAPWWDYLECQLFYAEARRLIDGAPPPDDPRLHVLRARAFTGLDWKEPAASEFDVALRLSPHDPQIRVEAHHNRGMLCIQHRRWRDAAAEFAKAAELRPDDACLWRFRAVAHLADGDLDAHRQTCTAMLERFGRTDDAFAAGNLLLACVLRQGAVPDMERLLPLTPVSDGLWHWGAGVRGAALYRAGRYEECVRSFETAAKNYRPRAWDWCFRAMASHRLGHADQARRCLSEARRWIDAANQHTEDDPTGTQPVWGAWHETVVYPRLMREAEELMKAKPVTEVQKLAAPEP
jgi:serine/threonine protein kinase/lipoprotein NlpI